MVVMKIEGGTEIAAALNALSTRLSARIQRDALTQGGELIRARASALAPRAPGAPDLADNINIGTVRSAAGSGEAAVGIGSGKFFFYDMFQEFGTSRQGAHPFYRPALDSEAQKSVKVIGSSLWSALIKKGFGSVRVSGGGGLL